MLLGTPKTPLRTRSLLLAAATGAALFALSTPRLRSQSETSAGISGVLTDSTGASVPGATVRATLVSTHAVRTTGTKADGSFSFEQLPQGEYQLNISAQGFRPHGEFVSYRDVPIQLNPHLRPAGDPSGITVVADDERLDATAPARVIVTAEEMTRIPSQSVSSPLSSLITDTAPGVSADSNGSFHPLGDHAEASYVVDGQPITDQQSRTFSSQVSLNALQSLEIQEGAPQAGVGDKTSMVIIGQTRSGLNQPRPAGEVSFARGAFATSQASAHLGYGTQHFGTFSALDALNSSRFLDTPELAPLHANGNAENVVERFDYRFNDKTSLQLNLNGSHSWFQTPNTYDQQAARQDQRQTIQSFNAAPSTLHTFEAASFIRTNLWVRQNKVRYRPSTNLLSDTPATLAQSRRLTNAGIRSEYNYSKGRHTILAGAEWKHTFLAERFSTGLTDPAYNSPCLALDGSPSPDIALSATSQCASAGLEINPTFMPGLVAIDLTRGGHLFSFHGYTDVKQEALFGQDSVRLGNLTANLGLRFDRYNGITASMAVQPRVGLAYTSTALHTVFRGAYSRIFITPYNENLIVASSATPGSTAASLVARDSAPLDTGHRNQFNIGFETQPAARVTFSGEYFWKFTYGAYDFDVLLNSPLTFPTQFRKSKIDGGLLRLNVEPQNGFAGFFTVSHVRSRLFSPQIGGVSFSAPYTGVTRPDHDEGLATNAYIRYQFRERGPWLGFSWRYDGGLVSVATPDFATVLRLTGDEQAQLGLHCGDVSATVAQPIRSCPLSSLATTRVRIPNADTGNADTNPSRIVPRNVFDIAFGQDALFRHEHQEVGFHVDIVNLTDNDGLYNFLSTFSGTHFLTPRSVTAQVRYAF